MTLPTTAAALTCLDALLVLGQVDSATPLRQLLEDAAVAQETGKPYAAAVIRKSLDSLPDLVTKSSYGAGYSLDPATRYTLLTQRATATNIELMRMAQIEYRSIQQASQRGYYYYLTSSKPVLLAALANEPKLFQESLTNLIKAQQVSTYYRPDTSDLDQLFSIAEADFWSWRHPTILGEFLAERGIHPLTITPEMATTLMTVYARHDLLEIEEWRRVELAGIYLIHRVTEDPAVRRKHVDLDLLSHILQGKQADVQLLSERIAVIEARVDLLDIVVLLLAVNTGTLSKKAAAKRIAAAHISASVAGLQLVHRYLDDPASITEEVLVQLYTQTPNSPLDWVALLWVCCWAGLRVPARLLSPVVRQLADGTYANLSWVAGELAHALSKLLPLHASAAAWRATAEQLTERYGFHYLLRLQPITPSWQAALQKVEQAAKQGGDAGAMTVTQEQARLRTIWVIDFDNREATIKEQKLGKSGYTLGRKLRWDEVFATHQRSYRTKEDLSTINALRHSSGRALSIDGHFSDDSLTVDFSRLLYELVGHPRLYIDDSKRIPLELRREQPSVSVAERDGSLEVRFDPPPTGPGSYHFKKVTPTRYSVYQLNDKQLALCRAIEHGIDVPLEARDRLEASLEAMREGVTIHSDTDLLNSDLPVVEGSDRLSVHLLPLGDGYRVEFLARPLPDLPLYFPPGEGLLRSLVAGEDGRRVLERDLTGEQAMAGMLVQACPALSKATSATPYSWTLDEELPALKFLLELRKLVKEQRCDVEYPRGQQLKLEGEGGFDNLELRVGKQRDWFQVDGSLRVDENRVLDLQFLLEQLRNNDSGFVKLKEHEFVAITDELRERVGRMEGLLHERSGKLQLPTLAAAEFSEVIEGLPEVELVAEWNEALLRIEQARHLRPRPPEPFDATLRDYQREGYDWMMRLAEWGVGACLADDMGLGKTVQGLAVLTARRDAGPALVLAPASVIRNWRAECGRFAPALKPVLMAHSSDAHLVNQLGQGDVLMVSYGLLAYVADELTSIEYATIIIDEAQAIKNSTTKRARIVSELRGDFKIATTGTPIENHLGELWSLFRFLNPGLLSSQRAFAEKYAIPITREEDAGRRDQLRKLVQPFILRRRKDEVLKELPAKTEIVLTVEPSREEAALYEALRRQALKEIAEAAPEEARFKVLAQLTKLRQAACHPRLVRPKSKLPSAKLELVGETIMELIDGGHKALVFSQFVKHLRIVEDWVKAAGIPYQYLDGSTPGKKREEYVDAFQRGEGKLFLISLKAGGTGLNLTEADYVLHLDPWWNPAVEDQASDRAHRIGQQKPVTVYRFVTQGTIEEQVIALHADKRDLADRILEGTGRAGKLEVDEILAMLRVS